MKKQKKRWGENERVKIRKEKAERPTAREHVREKEELVDKKKN